MFPAEPNPSAVARLHSPAASVLALTLGTWSGKPDCHFPQVMASSLPGVAKAGP